MSRDDRICAADVVTALAGDPTKGWKISKENSICKQIYTVT